MHIRFLPSNLVVKLIGLHQRQDTKCATLVSEHLARVVNRPHDIIGPRRLILNKRSASPGR